MKQVHSSVGSYMKQVLACSWPSKDSEPCDGSIFKIIGLHVTNKGELLDNVQSQAQSVCFLPIRQRRKGRRDAVEEFVTGQKRQRRGLLLEMLVASPEISLVSPCTGRRIWLLLLKPAVSQKLWFLIINLNNNTLKKKKRVLTRTSRPRVLFINSKHATDVEVKLQWNVRRKLGFSSPNY